MQCNPTSNINPSETCILNIQYQHSSAGNGIDIIVSKSFQIKINHFDSVTIDP